MLFIKCYSAMINKSVSFVLSLVKKHLSAESKKYANCNWISNFSLNIKVFLLSLYLYLFRKLTTQILIPNYNFLKKN